MGVFRISVLWLVLAVPAAFGQTTNKTLSLGEKIVNDAVVAFDVGIDYVTSPLRIDRRDALNLFKFGMATTATIAADRGAATTLRDLSHTNTLDGVMNVAREYGDTKFAFIFPAGVYIGGLVSGNDDIRVTGRQVFQALLYSSIVTQSLKWVIGRSRPDAGNDPFEARLIDFSEPRDDRVFSMPSGHSTVAFAISSVLAQRIHNTYASIGLYGLATTTAISRLYHNRHWLSDVFVGAVIGTATGIFVTTRDETEPSGGHTSPLRIMPSPTGLHLEYRF
jgi:hypothetical protein